MRIAGRLASWIVVLASASFAHAGTWTVDDDGPADFASIVTAIAAVPAGDTLLVSPGTYEAFELGKSLRIVGAGGAERPFISGYSKVDASTAVLAGLAMEALQLHNVTGPMRVDDCVIALEGFTDPNGEGAALVVIGCSQLLLTRCDIDGNYPSGVGISMGISLVNSTASLSGCAIHGASAGPALPGVCGHPGYLGVFLTDGDASFTKCTVVGGKGGITGCFSFPSDGWSASGIQSWQALVDLRAGTHIKAGPLVSSFSGQYAALSVHGGTAVLGGGTIGDGGLQLYDGAQLITATIDEPTLRVVPDSPPIPGSSGTLLLSAPPTAPLFLFVSLKGGESLLAALEGPLWLDLPVPILVPLAPGTTSLPWVLPGDDALIGSVITLQAVCPSVPGAVEPTKVALTGPDQIVVRF